MEQLYRKGVSFFYVSDDTFTMKKDRVIQICKKIIERQLNITWVAISRVNYVNEEMLSWMRKAGARRQGMWPWPCGASGWPGANGAQPAPR